MKEKKKYITAEDLKEFVEKVHAEEKPDTWVSMPNPYYAVRTQIVEEQDHMIMNAIRHIGGNIFQEITVDKHKVFDALSKTIPKKPTYEKLGKYITKNCPVCGRFLRITPPSKDNHDYDYCGRCGQAIDWSEVKDD